MIEQRTEAQESSIGVLTSELTSPLLYLSSTEAGWEGVVAQAFYEPRELEGWQTPATSDLSLVLFAGGAMHIESRHAQSRWKEVDIHHGELMLDPGGSPSQEVRWRCLSSVPTQTLHLHMSRDLIDRVAEEVIGSDPARLALVGRSGFRDPLLTQIGLALWRELEQPTPAGKLYAQTAAQMLAVHLVRNYTSGGERIRSVPQPTLGLTPRQFKQVVDFILAHLSEDLSLETLAQQAGFSPYHFVRLFRQTTGANPHQFVLRQRIKQAQALLRETDMPIVHIAQACGFAHQSHLTQVFKQHLGLTPRAYRQNYSTGTHL